MELVSRRFRDRPEKPVDTAIWWIDYVLRNEETHEYKMPFSAHQYWFQKRNLDVWLFIFQISAVKIYVSKKIVFWAARKCCVGTKSKKLKTK